MILQSPIYLVISFNTLHTVPTPMSKVLFRELDGDGVGGRSKGFLPDHSSESVGLGACHCQPIFRLGCGTRHQVLTPQKYTPTLARKLASLPGR
jgi:hypothetical protein